MVKSAFVILGIIAAANLPSLPAIATDSGKNNLAPSDDLPGLVKSFTVDAFTPNNINVSSISLVCNPFGKSNLNGVELDFMDTNQTKLADSYALKDGPVHLEFPLSSMPAIYRFLELKVPDGIQIKFDYDFSDPDHKKIDSGSISLFKVGNYGPMGDKPVKSTLTVETKLVP